MSCNDRVVDSVGGPEDQRLFRSVIALVLLSRAERAIGNELGYQKSDAQRTLKFLAALGLSALMGLSAVDAMAGSFNYFARGRQVKVNGCSGKVKGRYGSSLSW